jgi:hypothetical protein
VNRAPQMRKAKVIVLKFAIAVLLVLVADVASAQDTPQKSTAQNIVTPCLGCSIPRNLFMVAAEVSLSSDAFLWGLDLFNHGYYWEAHEAWEGLWQVADRDDPLRMLFKGLILLSAAGVKIRERKNAAAARHAKRGSRPSMWCNFWV